MLLYVGNKTNIDVCESRYHFENQARVGNRRVHVCKLVCESFEAGAVCFGGGKLFQVCVTELVL